MLTLSQGLDDKGEGEEAEEQDIEFLEAGKDAAEAFEAAEEPFDLVAFAVWRGRTARAPDGCFSAELRE